MWLLLGAWLRRTFLTVRMALFAAALIGWGASVGVAYFKGKAVCDAEHRTAQSEYLEQFNEQQLNDLFDVAGQSAQATEEYQKQEASNNEAATTLLHPLTSSDGCIDAKWVRGLSKLH